MRTPSEWSWRWVWASLAIYVVVEVALGQIVGNYLLGGFISRPLYLKLQAFLMLAAYASGGGLVGLISPNVRIAEPAIGAFLAVAATFLYTVFSPVVFYQVSPGRIALGGTLALVCAATGAKFGERLASRLGNDASQHWRRR
ncbi:MAG: hypothetical protein ABEN55_06375 [Bradymonadaceae bacterium]